MDEKKEKLDDANEETDKSGRRDFLKTATMAAGALAAVSTIGALVENEANAQTRAAVGEAKTLQAPLSKAQLVRGAQLNFAKTENRKSFGLSGAELGRVLKAEGFIPAGVQNLEKAALHASVSW